MICNVCGNTFEYDEGVSENSETFICFECLKNKNLKTNKGKKIIPSTPKENYNIYSMILKKSIELEKIRRTDELIYGSSYVEIGERSIEVINPENKYKLNKYKK